MILIVTGLPATGKSYFAKHAADEIGGVHLNTDMIRKKINKQGRYDENTKDLVYAYLKEEMIRHAQQNKHVVVDGTFHKQIRRKQFEQEARKHTREVYFVEMHASEDTIRKRLRGDRKFSEADYKVYRQIKHQFEPMQGSRLILQTDQTDVSELIQKLQMYIDAQRRGS